MTNTSSSTTRLPNLIDGEDLLRLVATAARALSEMTLPGDPVYPRVVQQALNHVSLACVLRGDPGPVSVPDLMSWAARKPLREWLFDIPDDAVDSDGTLVDSETMMPTQQCLEWVVSATDVVAEQIENKWLFEAMRACELAESPLAYTAFRRTLIEKPVMTGRQQRALLDNDDLDPTREILTQCYLPASAALSVKGAFATCRRCGCLLVPLNSGRYRCELDRCRRHPVEVGHLLDGSRDGGVLQLLRPLRMFITGPGLAEVDLERSLRAPGRDLSPQMWPEYDTYDLRFVVGAIVWAIDVKDHANPALLGRNAKPFRRRPAYDRAALVVPYYRFQDREDYKRVFIRNLNPSAGQITLLSDRELLAVVDRQLASVTASMTGERRA
ncbi:pPIWI_RE_Y domain-containing protein [Nocardia aurantia]|uniref:REase associating with pPIWI RE domain-containing protein n=1 Tax=Nocardia aurantia TaxID=2585199 RepID=A0A7K0E2I5_9NOCA|nr:hypothetical protein [Nocardia aurantia]MQY32018.1 hypothetical protein [Nocardia aurantia]